MTRRDYIELAAALNAAHIHANGEQSSMFNSGVNQAAHNIADLCVCRDPKFDVQRFLKNAGVAES